MIYRIAIYVQPWEIDDLERQIRHLILGSYYINKEDKVILDVTLNVSSQLVEWENSKIDKDYFICKYKYLETIAQQYFHTEFDQNENIQGCVDKRRSVCSKIQDFIIWLDPDVFFNKISLPYIIQASKNITNNLFVLSPQTIQYWDTSWDCLTHAAFLSEPHNHRDYFDMYSLDYITNENTISLKLNDTVKFGGGWFNLFPTSIFTKIPILEEFGSYGWEDLYVMLCCNYLKIPQYILQEIVVSEMGKKLQTNKDYFKPFLNLKKSQYTKISNEQFNNAFNNFIKTN